MPELPEVEAWRRLAERSIATKRIRRVTAIPDSIVFDGTSARGWAKALEGRRVETVHRKGKHLWMALDRRPWPTFHFGMTGSFRVYGATEDRPRFLKAELEFEDGTCLGFPNARRLGRLRLLKDPAGEPPISKLGFDPLLDMPGAAELAAILSQRTGPIKALLLDQSVFAGVGNWIADEVLYQARIRPARPASDLDRASVQRLRNRLKAIVDRAVDVDADSSRFPRTWLFHHRWGRKPGSRTSRGEAIVFDTIGGRTTAWVPERQA